MKVKMPPKNGWRTYAACFVLILAGAATGCGFTIPNWLLIIIAGFGGIAGRAAIRNYSVKTGEDVSALVKSLRAPTSSGS